MSAGRIVLLVFGILLVLGSFGLLIGGGVTLAFDNTFKDDQGFYNTGSVPINSASPAIVTEPADIHVDNFWLARNSNLVSVKIEASNSDSSKPIFIGIARESDMDKYLGNVSYDTITDVTWENSELNFTHHSGNNTIATPTSQTFWVASATGTGTQTLDWNIDNGSYTMIIMNADGSSPVDAEAEIGVKLPPIVHNVGLALLITGIVLLIGGGLMIYLAVRK